jgi:hypothetical protein
MLSNFRLLPEPFGSKILPWSMDFFDDLVHAFSGYLDREGMNVFFAILAVLFYLTAGAMSARIMPLAITRSSVRE